MIIESEDGEALRPIARIVLTVGELLYFRTEVGESARIHTPSGPVIIRPGSDTEAVEVSCHHGKAGLESIVIGRVNAAGITVFDHDRLVKLK